MRLRSVLCIKKTEKMKDLNKIRSIKRLWVSVLLVSFLAVGCSNDDDGCYTPNSGIIEVFNDYYPDASNVQWYYVNGYVVADFDYFGEAMEAWFSSDARWLYTRTEMDFSDMPHTVKVNFIASYGDYEIDDSEEIKTSKYGVLYHIEAENDNERICLLYDSQGILLRVYADVLPYSWWETF